jgi:uncharacterized protein (DUF3820 family)
MTTEEEKPKSYTEQLLELFTKQSYKTDEIKTIISEFSKAQYEKKRSMSDKIPFGKYKYKSVEDIQKFDPQYLKWLSRQDMLNNFHELKENILRVI